MKVAFYKGTHAGTAGILNRLIRWWTRGIYSHTEAVLQELSDGTCWCGSSSRMDGGVRFKRLALTPSNWDVFEINASADDAKAWFAAHIGRPYDLRGILGFVLRTNEDRARYFCSESVAASIGIGEAWRFDPNTLAAALRRVSTTGGGD